MTLLAEIALVVVAAITVAVSVAMLPEAVAWRNRRAPALQAARPEQLVRLESLVTMAGASALKAHAYLRPLLVEIAARRLAARGQTLERIPEAVGKDLLGAPLWEIVRPDRQFPEDRHGPGVPRQDLAAMVEALERL